MAHSRYLRQMARRLRVEQQLTVDELAKRLALPRSTIYYWVRDLPARSSRAGRVSAGPPRRRDAAKRRISRALCEAAYEDGLRSFEELAAQPTFRDFVCIYISRGYKRDRTRVALSDSDPAVMRLVNRWLLRLTDKSPFLAVQYEPERSLTELRCFWGETVGADARTIRVRGTVPGEPETEPSPPSSHGVLTITVEDTLLHARLQAWMRRTRESWL
jgi:excisionase family DNA binding protein